MAKNLIAYFTWSGNSAHLAQLVQGAAGGDLFHIRPQQLPVLQTAFSTGADTCIRL